MFEKLNIGGTVSTMLTVLLLTMVVTTAFSGAAAASNHSTNGTAGDIDPTSFICNNSDTVFVSFLQTLIGLFFAGSFAFGIIAFIMGKADTADTFGIIPDEWTKNTDKAVRAAFVLPVGVWFLTFLGKALFGYDLSCLMPLQ